MRKIILENGQRMENNVTVSFTNVSLYETKWAITDMNLVIYQSVFQTSSFSLLKEGNSITNLIKISNSTFGNLKICCGFKVLIVNCNVNGGKIWKDTLIDIENSNLNMTNCAFSNHKTANGAAVINAESSIIFIQNSNFTENVGELGVIQVANGCDIQIIRSIFHENGYWNFFYAQTTILIRSKSVTKISDCVFLKNIASKGGCLASYPNTNLIVENSKFVLNYAQKGGAVYCEGILPKENGTNLISYQSENQNKKEMSRNIQGEANEEWPAKFPWNMTEKPQCMIIKSTFRSNVALQSGGAIFIHKTSTEIESSTFEYSGSALSGGSIDVRKEGRVKILNSYFSIGRSLTGGVISAADLCTVIITDSIITSCFGMHGSCFSVESNVVLKISNITIQDNFTIYSFAKAFSFYLVDHCSVTIVQSKFSMDYHDLYIFYLENFSNLTVFNTTFNKTGRFGAATLMILTNVMVTF